VATAGADTLLRWSGRGLLACDGEPPAALLAADSWLVEDGAVRGLDAHWARFGGCCRELGVAQASLRRFAAEATAALPREGRWFPRVEVVEGEHLQLRLRAARPSLGEARVIVGAPGDPRTRPAWKGPDVELLLGLRAQAVAGGADELVLCDGDGRLVEGVFDSLLWWEGDALCTTPADRTLPGVTRRLVLEIARERGHDVRERSPLPGELAGCESWLANALHGIRVVTAWDGVPAASAPRAAGWRDALARTARPLPG
jgi:branched-subunit amino acid aminotransferase/4-amino-4-deoxychorismate lyase